MDKDKKLWNKCIEFHGHVCGGVTIGYKAALYAIELMGLDFSKDEEVVCVTENDACGVDAIQAILGCSVGKGNLLFKMRGKQAFSFYNRTTGESVRLVLKNLPDMEKKEKEQFLMDHEPSELFDVKEPTFQLPERARIFQSVTCEKCGEVTAESMIRLEGGKKLCLDCYTPYSRFH